MKSKDLKHMSLQELLKQKKTVRFVMGLLIGALITSFALNLYRAVNEGFSYKLVTPFALLPFVFVIRNSLKQIQEELATRPKQEL